MNIEQGTLKEVSAAALLLKIFEEERSGVLYLKRDEILKELYIDRGKLVWTASNSEVDTLESMLIRQKKIDVQILKSLKENKKSEIELGKILVEKGIMSLEELIEFSKIQMRKIVKSILKWGEGVYYFSKDVPANTFINLEINLRDFIHDFIKIDLDMGFIWKGIGSFQEVFIKSEANKKIEKYNLTKPELELLDKFTGEVNVEVISLNFVGMPKEDILKTIYFFLLSELLVKKDDDEKMDIPDSIIEQPDDMKLKVESTISGLDDIKLDDIGSIDEIGDLKSPEESFEDKESDVERIDISDHEHEEVTSNSDDISLTDRMLLDLKNEKSKKKGRLFNMFLIFVILAIIIAGGIFLVLDFGNDESKNNKPVKNSVKRSGGRISGNVYDKVGGKEKTGEKQKNPKIPDTKNSIPKGSDIKAIGNKEQTEPLKKASENEKTAVRKSPKITPMVYFRKGDFLSAGRIWRERLLGSGYRYSILLELDCLKESVKFAYKKTKKKNEFFILNHRRNGRNCYLVLFGKYYSEKDAESSISKLPSYFLNQSNPPRVLELSKYL